MNMKIVLTDQRHAAILSAYFRENEAHFRRWNPRFEANDNSVHNWQQKLKGREIEFRVGASAHFIGVDEDESVVYGTCSLTNIVRSYFQACYMGYSVDLHHEGQGIMTHIVTEVIAYAFQELKLKRIMANHMPDNERSARLLKKLGFQKEGLARQYLKINGRWEDHVLTSLLNPDPEL